MSIATPRFPAFTASAFAAASVVACVVSALSGCSGGSASSTVDGSVSDSSSDSSVVEVAGETSDASDASEVGDVSEVADTTADVVEASEAEAEAAECVDGQLLECHQQLAVNCSTPEKTCVIDCTIAGNEVCAGGIWGPCGNPLPFCNAASFRQRVTFYATSDDPPLFVNAWNTIVANNASHTQLLFDKLTAVPTEPTLQVLNDETTTGDALSFLPAMELTDIFGSPPQFPVGINPTTRAVHSIAAGTLQLAVDDGGTYYDVPVSNVAFDGVLASDCTTASVFQLTITIPQSGATIQFGNGVLAAELGGNATMNTTDPPGWTVVLSTDPNAATDGNEIVPAAGTSSDAGTSDAASDQ